ncbi:SDR family NAD(P)-dependent oxidoreductase [bacterium]|nr:SDR family NAD(P)-dependent oxidoreductase [bacterium]
MTGKTVVITGISGTLGEALGRYYRRTGWHVVGVSRSDTVENQAYDTLLTSPQVTADDANALLDTDPDLVLLNAGQIETEIGPKGEPLGDSLESITRVNYLFPSLVALEAAKRNPSKPLELVVIGSIADGSPSAFGPLYHASKIAVHYFVSGVGPILQNANSNIRLRLYRPGAIKGPLSWAPVNRLNKQGYNIRAKRCESAPNADHVAQKIGVWIQAGKQFVGTYEEPFSFKIFKYLFALAPNFFYRLQVLGWKKGSKFV